MAKETEIKVSGYTRKKPTAKKTKKVAGSDGILHEPRAVPQKRLPITEGVQVLSRNQDGKTKRTGLAHVSTQKGVTIYGRT